MKILLVANTLPPVDLSGVGEQVLQLSEGLIARGHEVRILGRGREGAKGPKLLFPLAVVAPFLREVRRFRPDVVQVHESDGALAALVLKTLGSFLEPEPTLCALLQVSYWQEFLAVRAIRFRGRTLGRPGVRELAFRWLKAPLQIVLGALTGWLADRVLAPSLATASELRRDYAIPEVAVVPNATAARPIERARTAGDRSGQVALFVGRLRVRKGLELALHAMVELRRRSGAPRLLIVGDGEHRQRLERSAERLDMGGSVEFLGRKPREEVLDLMDGATVLVVPSLYEGMPLVIVEAMQRGLAVVASAVSGIPEVVIQGDTGWLFPCEDLDALTECLKEAFDDPAEAARRGESGRRRLETRYAPAQVALEWEKAVGTSSRMS